MAVLFVDAYRRVRDSRRSQFGARLARSTAEMNNTSLEGFDDDEQALTPVRSNEAQSGRIGQGRAEPHEDQGSTKQFKVRISAQKSAVRKQAIDKHGQSAPQASEMPIIKRAQHYESGVLNESRKRKGLKEDLVTAPRQRKNVAINTLLQPALAQGPEAGDVYSARRNTAASQLARAKHNTQVQAATEKQTRADTKAPEKVSERGSGSLEPKRAAQAPAKRKTGVADSTGAKAPALPEVIVLHVAARADQEYFDGEQLVQNLLAQNMRHGDKKIFHRFERPEEHRGHLFSMANMVKPGTFELDHMNSFATPGVTFFLELPCEGSARYAFDLMLITARKLARSFHAELRDQNQNVLTEQAVDHLLQRVVDFERKHRMRARTEQIRERNGIL